jgi:thiamine-monophosphate kinase
MMQEKEIIGMLDSLLPSGRTDPLFGADAEYARLGTTDCLFSTDEFSAEDLFSDRDPETLGWNVAVGAISDILACGGIPRYYLHALCVGKDWCPHTLRGFGSGVAEALSAAGVRFLGGDSSVAHTWRCTVTVVGTAAERRVTRQGAAAGHGIYLTGAAGKGNLEAALSLAEENPLPVRLLQGCKRRFPLRLKESALMRRYASACIDTSDGLAAAADTLAAMNGCGYRLENIPWAPAGRLFARIASLPRLLLALAGCGEYELLCTVPPERERLFLQAARDERVRFSRIGEITQTGRYIVDKQKSVDLGSFSLDPRSFNDPRDYVRSLVAWVGEVEQ